MLYAKPSQPMEGVLGISCNPIGLESSQALSITDLAYLKKAKTEKL
jgi:hypothetical protein